MAITAVTPTEWRTEPGKGNLRVRETSPTYGQSLSTELSETQLLGLRLKALENIILMSYGLSLRGIPPPEELEFQVAMWGKGLKNIPTDRLEEMFDMSLANKQDSNPVTGQDVLVAWNTRSTRKQEEQAEREAKYDAWKRETIAREVASPEYQLALRKEAFEKKFIEQHKIDHPNMWDEQGFIPLGRVLTAAVDKAWDEAVERGEESAN